MSLIVFVLAIVKACCILVNSTKLNDSSLLTSTYSRVAKWGSSSPAESQARSGVFWSQSANLNRINLKPPTIVYSSDRKDYKPYEKTDDQLRDDAIPAKGEVLQDRFLPRPYFPEPSNDKPSKEYGTPAKPLPSYNSPFTSYNPPGPVYKPPSLPPPPPSADSTIQLGPPTMNKPVDFLPPPNTPATSGPPTMPPMPPSMPATTSANMMMYMKNNEPATPPPPPPPPPPKAMPSQDQGESDMQPPPPPAPDAGSPPDVSDYMDHAHYEHYDHHHIYETVPPPPPMTTTAAPPPPPPPPPPPSAGENKASHYSYFYLGRKLWYIPLYFSIYFIGYIIVLILKAIARHKVDYVQTYARSFDGSNANLLDEATVTVRSAIDRARDAYM